MASNSDAIGHLFAVAAAELAAVESATSSPQISSSRRGSALHGVHFHDHPVAPCSGIRIEDLLLADDPPDAADTSRKQPFVPYHEAELPQTAQQVSGALQSLSQGFNRHHQTKYQFETFYGFIEDPLDALHVIEGCINGTLKPFDGGPMDMARTSIRSGTIIVVPDTNLKIRRWRDNIKWSASRAYGSFLLYRQTEHATTSPDSPEAECGLPALENRMQIGGLVPAFSSKTLKPNTRLVKNGLTKRTITLKGSDGNKYRVVSYYTPSDVLEMGNKVYAANAGVSVDGDAVFNKASHHPDLAKLFVGMDSTFLVANALDGAGSETGKSIPKGSKRKTEEFSDDASDRPMFKLSRSQSVQSNSNAPSLGYLAHARQSVSHFTVPSQQPHNQFGNHR
ncbi:hypothetical protein HDU83_000477 [Entophlyctis luteolus]|nr:hypothetical protein HDU83_000477 [Entophlyctis luteolus]